MISSRRMLIFTAAFILMTATASADDSPRFRVELPPVFLADVPVPKVAITALTTDGQVDTKFAGAVEVAGLKLEQDGQAIPWGEFESGVLTRTSDPARKIAIRYTGGSVTVTAASGTSAPHAVREVPAWLAILPPLIAIVLAVVFKEVVSALFIAVLAGSFVLWSQPLEGARQSIETIILGQVADAGNAKIILFTMFLGAMIGVMSASGGTTAIVSLVTRFTSRREHGQVSTWLMGLVIFFDDYANTLLVGSTMRPVADRLRFSREKLAFLVDSTAAPVAGLSIVSTWVGVEIGHISKSFENIGLPTDELYPTFLATIPFRVYPLLLLSFVFMIAWSGRDFGAMLTAERRAQDAHPDEQSDADDKTETSRFRAGLAVAFVPLTVLLGGIAVGITPDNSTDVLMLAAFAASASALMCAIVVRTLSLRKSMEAWTAGLQSMLPAIVILVLAWSIATVCNTDHLNTSGYIVHLVGDSLSPQWLPVVTFLVSAVVSFATGSSYATMGLLMPLFVAVLHSLLATPTDALASEVTHPLMLGTIGAVLAGSIFGDHCSPISDTTVLSSAASGCDHLRHVATQLPYALTVGTVSIAVGYVPMGFGVSPWISLPCGFAALGLIVRFLGRRAE